MNTLLRWNLLSHIKNTAVLYGILWIHKSNIYIGTFALHTPIHNFATLINSSIYNKLGHLICTFVADYDVFTMFSYPWGWVICCVAWHSPPFGSVFGPHHPIPSLSQPIAISTHSNRLHFSNYWQARRLLATVLRHLGVAVLLIISQQLRKTNSKIWLDLPLFVKDNNVTRSYLFFEFELNLCIGI